MKQVADSIPGYTYGLAEVGVSPISIAELEDLKISIGINAEVEQYLHLAGDVLAEQVERIVHQWRSQIIVSIPHLARHSRTPDGRPIPDYLAKSNLRFQQWIFDTCLRPYDQDWLNYQHEIALRHTSLKKNKTDAVASTAFVPLRDIIGFVAVMNQTIKPYLAAKGHSLDEIEKMHQAWCKSLQLQIALWAKVYTDRPGSPSEW